MRKLIFDLDVKDDWPPFAAESLWLEETPQGLKVKSLPFFIRGVAFDDVIKVTVLNPPNARIDRVVAESGNSTVWLFFREGAEPSKMLQEFASAGIGFEGGAIQGYYSVNVPKDLPMAKFDRIVEEMERAEQLKIVYGANRHGG